jgi:thiamine-phosphate pyrophosphorylase
VTVVQLSPLCAICDAEACERAGWTVVDFASACLDGGATFLQLRAKRASSRWLFDTAAELVRRAAGTGALVVINDRADVARLVAAGGVHVGQRDLAPGAVRAIVGPDAILGLSTHTPAELQRALSEPVDYVAIGPIYESSTKMAGPHALGLDSIRSAASRTASRRLPLVAIGGITIDRAADVLAAGAQSVAVIADLLTDDPAARVRAYLDRLHV